MWISLGHYADIHLTSHLDPAPPGSYPTWIPPPRILTHPVPAPPGPYPTRIPPHLDPRGEAFQGCQIPIQHRPHAAPPPGCHATATAATAAAAAAAAAATATAAPHHNRMRRRQQRREGLPAGFGIRGIPPAEQGSEYADGQQGSRVRGEDRQLLG